MIPAASLVRDRPTAEPKAPVLLITPPSLFLLDERVFVSLGILKVAAVLEQAGHPVEMVDLSGIENFVEVAELAARASPAKVVGITTTTPQLPAAVKLAAAIRAARPDMRIVLGGPHVTLVCAAVKLERKASRIGRAHRALAKLEEHFDVLVAGDGELAIFEAIAPVAPTVIDADDPKGGRFMSSAFYEETPMPARHLVDMESYRYTIDGHQAYSAIGQLGCLAAGTPILLNDGRTVPVESIQVGDEVVCLDERSGRLTHGPVEVTYEREAVDLWELILESGRRLRITGEHPIWTPTGWTQCVEIQEALPEVRHVDHRREDMSGVPQVSTRQADVPSMQSSLRDPSMASAPDKLVQLSLQGGMAKDAPESSLLEGRPGGGKGTLAWDEPCRTGSPIEHREAQGCGGYATRPQAAFGDQARRAQPDEAPRGGREGLDRHAYEVCGRDFCASQAAMARGKDEGAMAMASASGGAESLRKSASRDTRERCRDVSVRRQRAILGGPLSQRQETSQPGLRRFEAEESDSAAWRILAHHRLGAGGSEGLRVRGVAGADHLVQGVEDQTSVAVVGEDHTVRFERVSRKRFLGRSQVFNISVCPGHSYVASGIVVHNCPMKCSFCGGRNSPSLRRIRTRSAASVVAELEHVYRTYGLTGTMFYDDELNINNRSCLELMEAIARLSDRLGVDFRLRAFVKAELFTPEQARAMYRAGFRWILSGFEGAHERILTNIQKNATVEDNTRCLETARAAGLKVKALMSVGHAGESEETIRAVHDWLLDVRPDDFDCTVITTYPGTPYYDEALPGIVGPDVWTYTSPKTGDRLHSEDVDYMRVADYYKGDPAGGYHAYVFTDHLAGQEIVRLRDWVEADVRAKLGIPFNPGAPSQRYEHSMGMGPLPRSILRQSAPRTG